MSAPASHICPCESLPTKHHEFGPGWQQTHEVEDSRLRQTVRMLFATQFSGPRDPAPTSPPRAAGSIRRTATIDITRVGDLYGPARIDARGRDLTTPAHGQPIVAALEHLAGEVDGDRVLRSLSRVPAQPGPSDSTSSVHSPDQQQAITSMGLEALIGTSVAGGFRSSAAEALGDSLLPGSLRHLLIDDFVGAVLVSGVAPQHVETLEGGGPIMEMTKAFEDMMFAQMSDLCAGWASDATMLSEYRSHGSLPVALGPTAPTLERSDDPWSWHELADLAPHAVRRRRRIDLGPTNSAGLAEFDVHFRDSHADGEGIERAVHEYSAVGILEVATGIVIDVTTTAHVLPWQECPRAVHSASNVIGTPVAELRSLIRAEFRGVSTCTHLNDMLRSLADLAVLAEVLETSADLRTSGPANL